MRRKTTIAAIAMAAFQMLAAMTLRADPVENVFQMARAFPAHQLMLERFKAAMQAHDYPAMHGISSNAAALFPKDAIWRYNLACSEARLGKLDEARESLLAAAELGFQDHAGAVADNDLALLRRDAAFVRAVEVMRRNAAHPEAIRGAAAELRIDRAANITGTNTVWDMGAGGFSALFEARTPSSLYAPAATGIKGSAGRAVNRWLSEGTASGNSGDIYDNHDRGHSRLDISAFTGMVPTRYTPDAIHAVADTGVSLFTFPGRIAIGNSSTAQTTGPMRASCARMAQDQFPHILYRQYISNCLYVYPQVFDFGAEGDLFPSRTPYVVVAPGASWSDRPLLERMATALAALRPEVKDWLAARGEIAPTLQYLLRMAQTNISERADYLAPSAHPVALDGAGIGGLRIAELAHSLTTNNIAGPVALRILADDSMNFMPGRDFPDMMPERFFDSPYSIARVWRARPFRRRMVVSAEGPAAPDVKFHWLVGQGNTNLVKITSFSDDARKVMIEIGYHEPGFTTPFGKTSSRVDVICIADNGINYSPPSFISWYFPPNEKRVYDEAGRILEIDYSARKGVYADPFAARRYDFRDVFTYGGDGAASATRIHPDGTEERL